LKKYNYLLTGARIRGSGNKQLMAHHTREATLERLRGQLYDLEETIASLLDVIDVLIAANISP